MSYYAFLNKNNQVTEVISGVDEAELIEGKHPAIFYGEFRGQVCITTFYDGSIRKNYAGVGFKYDSALDAFIPIKPYKSWTLDKEICQWIAPKPYPEDGLIYLWNESLVNWEAVE
jgi:hypothetical protein